VSDPLGLDPFQGLKEQWKRDGKAARLGIVLIWLSAVVALAMGVLIAMIFESQSGHHEAKWALLFLAVGEVLLISLGVALITRGRRATSNNDPDQVSRQEKLRASRQLISLALVGLVVVWSLVCVGIWHSTNHGVAIVVGLTGIAFLLVLIATVRRVGREIQTPSDRP
jgi:hypothetical protein